MGLTEKIVRQESIHDYTALYSLIIFSMVADVVNLLIIKWRFMFFILLRRMQTRKRWGTPEKLSLIYALADATKMTFMFLFPAQSGDLGTGMEKTTSQWMMKKIYFFHLVYA